MLSMSWCRILIPCLLRCAKPQVVLLRKSIIESVLRPELSGAEYLQGLLWLKNDPVVSLSIDAAASFDEDRIRKENMNEGEEDDPEAIRWLDASMDGSEVNIECAVS